MKKTEIENAIVVFDTSAIQARDKSFVINEDTSTFIETYSKKCAIDWVLPEVVRRELQIHFQEDLEKTYSKTVSSHKRLNRILNVQRKEPFVNSSIQELGKRAFNKAIGRFKFKIVKPCFEGIALNALYEMVLMKRAPFCQKNSDAGIKDFFILETLKEIYAERESRRIVFICQDNNFSKAIKNEFGGKTDFALFQAIEDYESFLKQRIDKRNDDWIFRITERSSKKFLNSKENRGLFHDENILEKILTLVDARNLSPSLIKPPDYGLLVFDSYSRTGNWTFQVGNPNYILQENKTIEWKNKIFLKKEYSVIPLMVDSNDLISGKTPVNLCLSLEFLVYWSCKVSSDAKISQAKLKKIEFQKDKLYDESGNTAGPFEWMNEVARARAENREIIRVDY